MSYDNEKIKELKSLGYSWNKIANELGYQSGEGVRWFARKQDWYKATKGSSNFSPTNQSDEVHSQTTLSDGSISSTIKTRLSEQKKFTKDELLELHGFDSKEFQIKTVTSNEWSMTNGAGEKYYNFQSKIIAEPLKLETFPVEKIEEILQRVEPLPIFIEEDDSRQGYLSIGLYDIHFGLNTLDEYLPLLKSLIKVIRNDYKEILIIVGGDFLHTDNLLNTTVKGTVIDQVDFAKMIEEAETFLLTLCKEAYQHSDKTKLIYLPGNHASSNDYMLVRSISALLPDIEADVSLEEYKCTYLGPHAIFTHHGDKRTTSQKLLEVIVGKYAIEWGQAKSRYLFTGHLHHEKTLDIAGMTHYQLMSPSKPSSYDKAKGYTTSETGLQVFEFDEDKRKAVYYL